MKKYIQYNLFFCLFFFCSLYGQKKDTLFIKIKDCNNCLTKVYKPIYFTDDSFGEYETVETEKGIHIPRLKKERFVFSNDLLKNKDISKYQIGVETRRCLKIIYTWSKNPADCDIDEHELIFYHASVSKDFIDDYIKYGKIREDIFHDVQYRRKQEGIRLNFLHEKPTGEYYGNIEEIQNKYDIYEIDTSLKKEYKIEEELRQLIGKYSVIYFESERIGNEILFHEVNYYNSTMLLLLDLPSSK